MALINSKQSDKPLNWTNIAGFRCFANITNNKQAHSFSTDISLILLFEISVNTLWTKPFQSTISEMPCSEIWGSARVNVECKKCKKCVAKRTESREASLCSKSFIIFRSVLGINVFSLNIDCICSYGTDCENTNCFKHNRAQMRISDGISLPHSTNSPVSRQNSAKSISEN